VDGFVFGPGAQRAWPPDFPVNALGGDPTMVAVNSAGEMLLATPFQGVLEFEGHQFISSGLYQGCGGSDSQPPDLLVAKFDAQGNTRWAVQLGGAGSEYVDALALGDDGTAYVVGTTTVPGVFNGLLITMPENEIGTAHSFISAIPDPGGIAPVYRALTTGLPPKLDCPTPRKVITATVEAMGPAGTPVCYFYGGAFEIEGTRGPATCLPVSLLAMVSTDGIDTECTMNVLLADGPGDLLFGPRAPQFTATAPLGDSVITCSFIDQSSPPSDFLDDVLLLTVQDTTGPDVTTPKEVDGTATGLKGAIVRFDASATDLVDGSVPVTCTPASGSQFPLGTSKAACSATDAHKNQGVASFEVNVTYAWSNFLPPVSPAGTSTFKQGSIVPVKFQLTGASAGASAVARVSVYNKDASYVTNARALRFGNTFLYFLNTRRISGDVTVQVDFGDGAYRATSIKVIPR
jgi:hypothetical protein